jgi:putative SOS response-associated peptidase YedK
MCYSAMVEQNAKKLGLKFKARVQTEMYDYLFAKRLEGEKIQIGKAMEFPFVNDPQTNLEKSIADKISRWHEARITEIESALFAQSKRLADAERILSAKATKKAENDKRISSAKIEKFKHDLKRHADNKTLSDSDSRIFPLHYMSMVTLGSDGKPVVVPVRYLMRPANKDASFDVEFNGCYNARLDSLDRVAWWKNVVGQRRGIILVRRFFENVSVENFAKGRKFNVPAAFKDKKNIVLCFEPDGVEYMYVPVLWDIWKKEGETTLYSAALITDEPAPEIAEVGHDRTPIFLKESAVELWLNAQNKSMEEIKAILAQRETPHYSHRVVGAA